MSHGLQCEYLVNLQRGQDSNKHKDCVKRQTVGATSLKFLFKLSRFSLHSLRKKDSLALSDSQSEIWEKMRNISLESHVVKVFEATRIQDPVLVVGRRQILEESSEELESTKV